MNDDVTNNVDCVITRHVYVQKVNSCSEKFVVYRSLFLNIRGVSRKNISWVFRWLKDKENIYNKRVLKQVIKVVTRNTSRAAWHKIS